LWPSNYHYHFLKWLLNGHAKDANKFKWIFFGVHELKQCTFLICNGDMSEVQVLALGNYDLVATICSCTNHVWKHHSAKNVTTFEPKPKFFTFILFEEYIVANLGWWSYHYICTFYWFLGNQVTLMDIKVGLFSKLFTYSSIGRVFIPIVTYQWKQEMNTYSINLFESISRWYTYQAYVGRVSMKFSKVAEHLLSRLT